MNPSAIRSVIQNLIRERTEQSGMTGVVQAEAACMLFIGLAFRWYDSPFYRANFGEKADPRTIIQLRLAYTYLFYVCMVNTCIQEAVLYKSLTVRLCSCIQPSYLPTYHGKVGVDVTVNSDCIHTGVRTHYVKICMCVDPAEADYTGWRR